MDWNGQWVVHAINAPKEKHDIFVIGMFLLDNSSVLHFFL